MDGQQYNINPNVVLTADNGQYDVAMSSSAQATDRVTAAVDTLTQKISAVTKTAGKTLVGISAADILTIGGATAAWASYEKQVSQLNAQAATLTRTQSAAAGQMKVFTQSVTDLRSQFGATTSDAAALTLTLSKMSDHTAALTGITSEFEKMSKATGESANGLAASVLNLQKIMGTPQRETKAYADQLTTLASSANTSAGALADFASQIAPIGRAVGMTQTEITGVSKAFISAGQDGYRAASAFNKIMSDIAYQTSTGSPGLAKYSNLVGTTVAQFKQMSGAEKAVAIFDSLNRMGPRAIVQLNQMGLDGTAMIKSITAMSQQSGGLGTAIQQARAAYNDGSVGRGSAAAQDNMHDELSKLRQELEMTAEAIGSVFGPAVTKVVGVMDKFAAGVANIANGPIGKVVGVFSGIAGGAAAMAGGLLLAAGALTKLAGGAFLWRNSGMLGFREGFKGAQTIKPGSLLDSEGNPLFYSGSGTTRGNQIAEGGTRFQRFAFNTGVRGAMGVNRGISYLESLASPGARLLPGQDESQRSGILFRAGSPMAMTQEARDAMTRGQQISRFFGSALYAGPAALRGLVHPQFDALRFPNPADRTTYFGSGGSQVPFTDEVKKAAQDVHRAEANVHETRSDPYATQAEVAEAEKAHAASLAKLTAVEDQAVVAARNLAAESKAVSGSFSGLATSARETMAALGESIGVLAGAAEGAAVGGLGMMAKAGKGLMGMAGGPLGVAMIGSMVALPLIDHFKDHSTSTFTDYSGAGSAYAKAGGVDVPGAFAGTSTSSAVPPTRYTARHPDTSSQLYAQSANYQPFDKQIKGKSQAEVLAYLGPLWSTYKKNPQSVYGVQTDLLNAGFDQTTVAAMIGQLDAGNYPGLGVYASQVMAPGRNNAGASYYLNHALGIGQDATTALNTTQGQGAALANLSETTAQTLMGFGSKTKPISGVPGSAANAFNASLASKYFGGTDLSSDQITRLFYNPIFSPGMGSGGKGTSGPMMYSAAPYVTAARKNGLNTPEEAANFHLGVIGSLQGFVANKTMSESDYEKTVSGYLGHLGISDPSKYQNSKTALQDIKDALLSVFNDASKKQQDAFQSLGARISELGGAAKEFGAAVADQKGTINRLLMHSQSPLALNRAVDQQAQQQGVYSNPIAALTRLMNIRGTIADPNSPDVGQVAQLVQQRADQVLGLQQQFMTPPQAFKSQVAQGMAKVITLPSDATAQEQSDAKFGVVQTMVDQAMVIKQQLLQQIQFNLSMARSKADFGTQMSYGEHDYQLQRSRAEQDFNLQRAYAAHDYNLSRAREEEDFNISRNRNEYQFHLSLTRNLYDFNLQRKRAEEDYHHSTMLMIAQQAQAMYAIYDRVQVAQTDSATYLLANSQDQTKRMQDQEAQLGQLRGMGLHDNVIQQLGFTKTENAQQLARFVAEVSNDPELIAKFNKEIGDRLKAAAALTKDSSSSDWQEYQRQYKLQRDRAQADFQRSVQRSRADFKLQMNQMESDFQRSMSRQAQDYETSQQRASTAFHVSMDRAATDYATSVERMRVAFKLSMDRAQEDMDVLAKGVQGTIHDVMVQGAKELRGELGKQAADSLKTFDRLGTAFGTQGWQIMKMMASIFGFKAPPKPTLDHTASDKYLNDPANSTTGSGQTGSGGGHQPNKGLADGGVLPGFTPGRDVHVFHSATAGDLALSGGESVMRPEWTLAIGGPKEVERQNNLARRGMLHSHYAAGGVFRPMAIGTPGGIHDVGTGFPAVDMPVPEGTAVHSVAQGKVVLSKDLVGGDPRSPHDGGYHSYGRYIEVDHGAYTSLYAHLSQRIAALAQMVTGGQIIGLSGHTGYTLGATGNHLHFGVKGRSPLDFMGASTNYGSSGSVLGPYLGGGANGTGGSLTSILQSSYPALEAQAAQFMGGIIPAGHLSKMINQWARSYAKQYGGSMGYGNVPNAPGNVSGAIAMGKQMAAARGWTGNNWDALYQLWQHESGWDPTIHYGGGHGYVPGLAYGIPQALPGTKMAAAGSDWVTNPATQIKWGLGYIASSYGNPSTAWSKWQGRTPHWYGKGGVFAGAQDISVGENGPEMVLPLNNLGAQFMADTLKKYSTGDSARAHGLRNAVPVTYGGGGQYNTYHVDRSTQINGPITVQANNPNDLVNQLQARQRVMALTNPVRGGSRV